MSRPDDSDPLLAEQIAYYRAIAPEYEDHAIPGAGEDELIAAIDAFQPTGDVLELACGPGVWTERLLHHATSVTAVDAAPEMLARAKARVGEDRVRFVLDDPSSPERRHRVPGGESSIPPSRPRGPTPAAGVAGHGDSDFRALLLGARHAGPFEEAGRWLAGGPRLSAPGAAPSHGAEWAVPGSNQRPPACKAGALPTELTALRGKA